MASVFWNIKENKLTQSDRTFIQYGFEPNEISPEYEAFEKLVHADDFEYVNQAVNDALDGKKPYSVNFRVKSNDGRNWIMHAQGTI